jgi:hypothetical protein
MKDLTVRIHRNQLQSQGLDFEQQHNILKYALRVKDYSLVELLLNYQGLEASLLEVIINHKDMELKFLYFKNLNNKPKELLKALTQEPMGEIHCKLALITNTSAKVLTHMANNQPNFTLTQLLLNNEKTPAADKLLLLKKLLSPGFIPLNKNKQPKITVDEILFDIRISENVELFKLIAGDISLLSISSKLLPTLEMDESFEKVLLELYTKATSFILINPKAKEQSYQYIKELYTIISSPKLSLELREEIVTLTTKMDLSHQSAKVKREFVKLLDNLTTGNTLLVADFKDRIEKAIDAAELKLLCVQITQSNVSKNITNQQYDQLLLKVLANKSCPKVLADTIFENFDPNQFSPENLVELIPDPKLYGQVLAYYFHGDLSQRVELSSDPKSTYLSLLEHSYEYATQLKSDLFWSKYWKEELFLTLPVSILTNQDLPPELETSLANLIVTQLPNANSWEVFSSLGKDFTGSLGELLNISSKI